MFGANESARQAGFKDTNLLRSIYVLYVCIILRNESVKMYNDFT